MKTILILPFLIFGLIQSHAQLAFPDGPVLDIETTNNSLYLETEIAFYTGSYTITDYSWSKAFTDSIDPRWDFQACMNGDCKIGMPTSGHFIGDFGLNDTTGFIRFHVYTYNQSGKSIVKYYVTNNLDPTDQALLTFNITYRNTTAVKPATVHENKILVYPNPASTFLNVKSAATCVNYVRIFNALSELVFEGSLEANNNMELIVPVAALPQGMYHLEIGDYRQLFAVTR